MSPVEWCLFTSSCKLSWTAKEKQGSLCKRANCGIGQSAPFAQWKVTMPCDLWLLTLWPCPSDLDSLSFLWGLWEGRWWAQHHITSILSSNLTKYSFGKRWAEINWWQLQHSIAVISKPIAFLSSSSKDVHRMHLQSGLDYNTVWHLLMLQDLVTTSKDRTRSLLQVKAVSTAP